MSVLDWLNLNAPQAEAAPQPQAGEQSPIDDLALRGELAKRLREAMARGVTNGDQAAMPPAGQPIAPPQNLTIVPKTAQLPMGAPQNNNQDMQDRFSAALTQPPSQSSTPLAPQAQPNGLSQPQEGPTQPPKQIPAPVQPAAAQPLAAPASAPVQPPSDTSAAFQRLNSLQPSARDSFAAFLAGSGDTNMGVLGRLGSGMRAQDQLAQGRLANNATYNALTKNGMPSDLAISATLNAGNPAVMELIKQTLSPKTQVVNNQLIESRTGHVIADFRDTATKQATTSFDLPGGEKVTGTFDPAVQGYVASDGSILSGPHVGKMYNAAARGALPQSQPAQPQGGTAQPSLITQAPAPLGTNVAAVPQTGILAPRQAQPENPYALGAPPPGTDAKTFRTEGTKKMADEMANEREKAIGAAEFLAQSQTARSMIDKHGHVIGRFAQPDSESPGHSIWETVLNPQEYVKNGLKFARDVSAEINPTGLNAANNQSRDQLNQAFTKLAQAGLKATYGARVTNVDVKQQNQTVPRLTDQDAETSLNKLDTIEQQSWRTLDRSINSNLINPTALDPDVLVRGLEGGHLHLSPAMTEAVRNYYAAKRAQQ